nr:purine nucleoside phosphoramidase [uncultured archaeon]
MNGCLFCKIIKGEIPTKFVYQDREIVVFADIKPKARVHLLVVPTLHIKSFLDLSVKNFSLLTKMVKVIQRLIREQKIGGSYHLVINGGARLEVSHLHWHLLGD